MRRRCRKYFVALIATATAAAPGLTSDAMPLQTRFSGPYAGAEFGVHEHHFYIKQTNIVTGATQGRYYRAWGIGGGAFAGYDLPLSPRLRLGAEAGLSFGGKGPVAHFPDGTSYAQHPQWGLRGTARAGYLLTDNLLAYGTFGYGGHRYRIDNTAGVSDAHAWGSSFTIGAGLEYRLSPHAGIRLDFRHLDNSMSHILVGIPFRF